MVGIDDIPQEILEHIFSFVSPYDDFNACKLVCKSWYHGCISVEKKQKAKLQLSLENGTINWENFNLKTQRNVISGRYSHSSCINGSCMYVFGGCTSSNTTFNDLWKFSLSSNIWIKSFTRGAHPSPKSNATMVSYKKSLILFGGWNPSMLPLHYEHTFYNELHIFDLNTNYWLRIHDVNTPPPLAAHSATIQNNLLVIFGGLKHESNHSPNRSNDIFCFDLISLTWFQPVIGGEKPQPRYGHSQMKIDGRNILIIGGCGGQNNLLSDAWLLTLPDSANLNQSIWLWSAVSINGVGKDSIKLLCNPACKVADTLVVLLPWHPDVAKNSDAKRDMRQLLIPSSVRRQPVNVMVPYNPHLGNNHFNFNDQYDYPRQQAVANSSSNSFIPTRTRPSIRPNASYNREKRLLGLSKMEQRMLSLTKNQFKIDNTSKTYIVPHLLDLKNVISSKSATWLPVSLTEKDLPSYLGIQPSPCLLYSLLLGKNHLVMFGGIPNKPSVDGRQYPASNLLTFISAAF